MISPMQSQAIAPGPVDMSSDRLRSELRPRSSESSGWPPPATGALLKGLHRKEVIQPQLPLRLPCYDFTPVTSPTFDGSLPKGVGHPLRGLLTPLVSRGG